MKTCRNMKVYNQSGYHYKSTPTITLKGQWLRELDFLEGDHIKVHCTRGKITITKSVEAGDARRYAAQGRHMVAEPNGVYGA